MMINKSRWISLLAIWVCVALCALPCCGLAGDYYVTPTGGASGTNGANWDNAFSNIQAAIDLATNANDTVYLQYGTWSNTASLVISNKPNVIFRGGCNGLLGGSSNEYSGANSTLTRTGGVMRIVYGYASTSTLSGVTISGGYFTNGANNGAGMYFANCVITLTNCVVRNNTNICSGAAYGGGVYAGGGSLTILDSAFNNNSMRCAGGNFVHVYGGAIAAVSCPLSVRGSGSVFSNNLASTPDVSANSYGGAIYANGAALTLDGGARLLGNMALGGNAGFAYGGAVYHAGSGMSATITGCWFVANFAQGASIDIGYGGAVCLYVSTGSIAGCTFSNNYASGRSYLRGGGVYANGLQSLQVDSSVFYGNWVSGSPKLGAAFYVEGCTNTVMDRCAVDGSGLLAGTAPELAYVTNGGSTVILNSIMRNNNAGGGLNFAGAAGSALALTNCVIIGNNGNGLTFTNGSASLFNCLMARNAGDGIGLAAGTVTVANCTLAENGGWGMNRAGGTGTVVNSIACGNFSGGILSNANLWVDYSCLQTPAFGGASNLNSEALFANVHDSYYLSVNGLTNQTMCSPCIDAGSNTPAFWGLDTRTTRTDGANDTNTVVDLGYHYTNGVSDSSILTVTNCYVDAVNGNDASNGLAWDSAWRSITHAFSNVAANATINVATGTYNSAVGEMFPLTVQMPGLTLAASNATPSLTVVDNAGIAGQRVLQASVKGTILLKGMTFRGGSFTTNENYGAGLKFQGCAVTLTNCVVRDNTNAGTATLYGGGLYAAGGSLTILDSAFNNNSMRTAVRYVSCCGGGIAAVNCPLVIQGSASVFSNNAADSYEYSSSYGGAIYANGAALTLDVAILIGNRAMGGDCGSAYGGAVYHAGSGMSATIAGCWFVTNANFVPSRSVDLGYGGAVCLAGSTGLIAGCTFTNNYSYGRRSQYGGCIYASGLQSLQVGSNVFYGNWVVATDPANTKGGTFYVTNCANTVLEGCTIDGSGLSVGTAPEQVYVSGGGRACFLNSTLQNNNAGRGMYFAGAIGSILALTNCLIVKNASDGLWMEMGTAAVVNCTLANNGRWGIARPTDTALTVRNSILWGNYLGGIGHNQNLALTYTDSQDGWAAGMGAGNFSADPLFVDAAGGDFHEMSLAGSWHGGSWTNDAQMSPCIDAGEPAPGSAYALEHKPTGGRINMGAYGNTPQSSLSSKGTVVRIW